MSLVTLFLSAAASFFSFTEKIDSNGNQSEEDRIIIGSTIMKDVFNRFHINYEMSRTHKIGYYQEIMSDSQSIHYLAESIVDIYVPSNLNQIENASVQPLRTRKKAYLEISEESLLFGNASDMARSSIWRPNSFLNEKNREDYVFEYLGESSMNSFNVFVIDFQPKNSKGLVSGKMFVDMESLAIIRIDYVPDASSTELWDTVSWSEEFSFKRGAFELTRVIFEGLSSQHKYRYNATLFMDQVEVVSQIPHNDSFINEEVSLFNAASDDFDQNFWRGYYQLKKGLNSSRAVSMAGH